MSGKPASTSFTVSRLNKTTFVVTEHDRFGEYPLIYVKLHPRLPVLILSDTGCNAPGDPSVQLSLLRNFLEEFPVPDNGDRPLNPRNASTGHPERHYTLVLTHCHYDHIGGLEQFPTQPLSVCLEVERAMQAASPAARPLEPCTLVASGHCESFLTHHLAEHSLCKFHGLHVPRFRVSRWAKDGEQLQYNGQQLDITVLHTPGHTPDELAWYDHHERSLYVGDSFYELGARTAAMVFPKEGDWVDYLASLAKLLRFVRRENEYMLADSLNDYNQDFYGMMRRVTVGCGHSTSGADAEELLEAVFAFYERVLMGKVPIVRSDMYRDEIYDTWMEATPQPRFAVRAPRRLAEEARKELGDRAIVDSIV